MRVKVGTVVILLIVTVLALAVAGCGGGDSESAARTSSCKRLAEAAQKFSAFATGRDSDFDATEEIDDLAVFSALAIHPGAPDEIRDDLQVLDDAFLRYVDAVADADLGNLDQEALEELQKPKTWKKSEQQKIQRASQNVSAWAQEKC
jgi:hypothetical protein